MPDHLWLLLDFRRLNPGPVAVYDDEARAEADGKALYLEAGGYHVVPVPYVPGITHCVCGHPYDIHRHDAIELQLRCTRCRCATARW